MKIDRAVWILSQAAMIGFVVLSAGCSNGVKVYPVRGEVFANNKPAAGAVVHLHPRDKGKSPAAFATVQSDGTFQMTTFLEHDGAAMGDYVVTIAWREEKKGSEGETIVLRDKLREQYSKPEKSGLKATVQAGENTLPRFNLTK